MNEILKIIMIIIAMILFAFYIPIIIKLFIELFDIGEISKHGNNEISDFF